LGATFVLLGVFNSALYAVFADAVREYLATAKAQRRFSIAGGSLLSIAGVWALLAKRPA
jgi:threonine/homoserine/homoserine lactone efflux protein